MFWSVYDTLILVTGLLVAALAVLPIAGIERATRVKAGLAGGGIVLVSIILGNLSSFVYPSFVWVAPVLALVIVIAAIMDARKRMARATQPGPVAAPQPAPPAAPEPVPDVASDAARARARDPLTPPADLYALAQSDPQSWPDLAVNPSTYPDLLTWLRAHGDPVTQAALERRVR